MTTLYDAFKGEPCIAITPNMYYCEKLGLYWKNDKAYDQLSAEHNGIIGAGATLRERIKEHNYSVYTRYQFIEEKAEKDSEKGITIIYLNKV